ncbi:hypothetical protein [Bizionia sp.]|uniref:hypothetical protein n=1 Tax=Bizionia sp. TaxID=1954480 RepID=UPI003A950803
MIKLEKKLIIPLKIISIIALLCVSIPGNKFDILYGLLASFCILDSFYRLDFLNSHFILSFLLLVGLFMIFNKRKNIILMGYTLSLPLLIANVYYIQPDFETSFYLPFIIFTFSMILVLYLKFQEK